HLREGQVAIAAALSYRQPNTAPGEIRLVYRLATYQGKSGPRAGIITGDVMLDAAEATGEPTYNSVVAILTDWPRSSDRIATRVASGLSGGWPVADAHLRAPVLWPSAIYCAGANY